MTRTITLLLVGGVVLAFTGIAAAQMTHGEGLGLGAHYSWVRNQDTEESTDMFGAMARIRGAVVGIEGAVDYRNEDMGGNVELKSWPVSASLLVYPVPVVYGLAGLSWHNTTLDFPDAAAIEDQTDTQLGYQLGAGVEVPLATNLAVTGDFRYHFIDYEFDEIPSSIGNVDADRFALNGGFLIYLR